MVDAYEDKILQWIQEGILVAVMLERVRKDPENPCQGGDSIFYQRVKRIRREKKITKQKAIWRFERLPGEYLQVDWGEMPSVAGINQRSISNTAENGQAAKIRIPIRN